MFWLNGLRNSHFTRVDNKWRIRATPIPIHCASGSVAPQNFNEIDAVTQLMNAFIGAFLRAIFDIEWTIHDNMINLLGGNVAGLDDDGALFVPLTGGIVV